MKEEGQGGYPVLRPAGYLVLGKGVRDVKDEIKETLKKTGKRRSSDDPRRC